MYIPELGIVVNDEKYSRWNTKIECPAGSFNQKFLDGVLTENDDLYLKTVKSMDFIMPVMPAGKDKDKRIRRRC